MRRRDISTALLASVSAAALTPRNAQAQTCTAPCYPTISAETKAGVTVVNTAYPPFYVDRYVNNTSPGTTDTSPGFNAAFKVCQAGNGGKIRYGATAPYATTNPINFTTSAAPNQGVCILSGEAWSIDSGLPLSIVGNHTGHVFDLTGTEGIEFDNVCITSGSSAPKTAIFQARNSSGASVGQSRFVNCNVIGNFSVAAYYNYGAEGDEIVGGYWYNGFTGGAAAVLLYTANNIKAESSSFQTVATGSRSCLDHKIIGGDFNNHSGNSGADVIYLESIASLKMFGLWMACSNGTTGGRSLIYVDMTHAPSNIVEIFALQGESEGSANPSYGICFSANAQTCNAWDIIGAYFPTSTRAIFAGAGAALTGFNIQGVKEATSLGLQTPSLTASIILSAAMVLDVTNTLSGNLLVGAKANMTLPGGVVGTNVLLDIQAANVYAAAFIT